MVKAGNDVKRDHSEARRYRYGFHAHRQPALSKRREEHRHEYAELRQAYLANYVNFVASVEKENRYKRKQYEAELLEWENQRAPYLAFKKKYGLVRANKRYENFLLLLEISPIAPTQQEPPKYEKYAEKFLSYRGFVQNKLKLPNNLYN